MLNLEQIKKIIKIINDKPDFINELKIDYLYLIFNSISFNSKKKLIKKLSEEKKLSLFNFINEKKKNSFSLFSLFSYILKLLLALVVIILLSLFIFYKINPEKFSIFINKIKDYIKNKFNTLSNLSTPTPTIPTPTTPIPTIPTPTTPIPTTPIPTTPIPTTPIPTTPIPTTPIPTATIGPLPSINSDNNSRCQFLEARVQNHCGTLYNSTKDHKIDRPPYNHPKNLECNDIPNNNCRKGIVLFKTLCDDYIQNKYGEHYKDLIEYYDNCRLDKYQGSHDSCKNAANTINNKCCNNSIPGVNCDNRIPNIYCNNQNWSNECKNAFDYYDNSCRLINIGTNPDLDTFKFYNWLNTCNNNQLLKIT